MRKPEMKKHALLVVSILLSIASCRHAVVVPVQTTDAADIPREIAVSKLQELLPTAAFVLCRSPRAKLRQDHVNSWEVSDAGFTVIHARGEPLVLDFADVTSTRLLTGKGFYIVQIFTTGLGEYDHFQIWFDAMQEAKSTLEALEALRQST